MRTTAIPAGLIERDNQYYPDFELSTSTGIATSRPGDRRGAEFIRRSYALPSSISAVCHRRSIALSIQKS